MGADSDPDAVVDVKGRVRGVAGLRIVDASVMPATPRAPTHLTTIMIAEKMADAIIGHDQAAPQVPTDRTQAHAERSTTT